MNRLEEQEIAAALRETSASTVAGLLAADPVWRARAADRLAHDIVTRIATPQVDRNQLRLPL